jgi:hypothetical protein
MQGDASEPLALRGALAALSCPTTSMLDAFEGR